MSSCRYETKNGRCGLKDCYAYRHKCFTEDLCKCHEPLTNANRIRAMSDEELAKFIMHGFVPDSFGTLMHNKRLFFTENDLVEWLQQPAEGGVMDGAAD